MRLIPVSYLQENSEVAINIVNEQGQLLLAKGHLVNIRKIERIKEKDISHVYINDRYCFNKETYDSLSNIEGILGSVQKLKMIARRVTTGISDSTDMLQAQSVCREIIKTVCELENDFKIRYEPSKLIINSIQEQTIYVAIMAVVMGARMGYTKEKLEILCMATLLKDLALLSPKLKDKTEHTQKIHPILTCEYLRQNYKLPEEVLEAILHHHENYDGTGYPNSLQGEQISETARIINIVEAFYELKSSHDMIHSTQELFEAKMKKIFTRFDMKILTYFISNVDFFTLDTMVLLNNQDVGVVVKNNYKNPFKPILVMIQTKHFQEGQCIALEDYPELTIRSLQYYI